MTRTNSNWIGFDKYEIGNSDFCSTSSNAFNGFSKNLNAIMIETFDKLGSQNMVLKKCFRRLNGKKGSNSNKEETGNNSKKDLPDLLDEVKKDRDRRRRNSKNDNKRDERKDEKKSEKKEDKDGNKKKGDENAKKEDTSDDDDIEEICVITKAQAKPQEGKTKEGKDQNQKSEASQTEPPKDPKAELLENLVIKLSLFSP